MPLNLYAIPRRTKPWRTPFSKRSMTVEALSTQDMKKKKLDGSAVRYASPKQACLEKSVPLRILSVSHATVSRSYSECYLILPLPQSRPSTRSACQRGKARQVGSHERNKPIPEAICFRQEGMGGV